MAIKKRKQTAFKKLASKQGVDLGAEKRRAEGQARGGRIIQGTTSQTLIAQRKQKNIAQQKQKTAQITLTSDEVKRIKAGTLKATAETTTAVKAGTAIIQDPTAAEKAKGLGVVAIAALSITPAGRGVKVGKAVIGQTAKAQIDRQLGTIGANTIRYSTNTATEKLTISWLSKLAKAARNPIFVVTALLGAIGSYPFAGFIKEEALQTLSFGVRSAITNNDIEGAELALEQQKDILNPEIVDKILSAIPYANVLSELKKFFDAARTKIKIDEQVVADMKIQIETGETENDKWKRVREEEAAQDKAAVDYYNEQRKQQVIWEQEAKTAARKSQSAAERKARNEDAAFWRKEREKQREKEAKDRKAIADFWISYRKEQQKIAEDSRPSNLNFGLL